MEDIGFEKARDPSLCPCLFEHIFEVASQISGTVYCIFEDMCAKRKEIEDPILVFSGLHDQ
jgi:hypothetical protein